MKNLGLLALASHVGGLHVPMINTPHIMDEVERKKHRADIDAKMAAVYKKNGLKRFNINGKEIWALNLKNARRKSAK